MTPPYLYLRMFVRGVARAMLADAVRVAVDGDRPEKTEARGALRRLPSA